jgi:Flp pilus assembly protein TadD
LTVEQSNPTLAVALADLGASPSAAALRRVANAYQQLRILDAAYAYYTRALSVDRRDVAAFDGRARVWRDAGFPFNGLSDAYRALYLAPRSAAVVNTLGTLFEAGGDLRHARELYEQAHQLAPAERYPLINLCHVNTFLARPDAVLSCERARDAGPQSAVARNNLAIAYAAEGDFVRAASELSLDPDAGIAAYNLGMLYLAGNHPANALASFREALREYPNWYSARERIQLLEHVKSR